MWIFVSRGRGGDDISSSLICAGRSWKENQTPLAPFQAPKPFIEILTCPTCTPIPFYFLTYATPANFLTTLVDSCVRIKPKRTSWQALIPTAQEGYLWRRCIIYKNSTPSNSNSTFVGLRVPMLIRLQPILPICSCQGCNLGICSFIFFGGRNCSKLLFCEGAGGANQKVKLKEGD